MADKTRSLSVSGLRSSIADNAQGSGNSSSTWMDVVDDIPASEAVAVNIESNPVVCRSHTFLFEMLDA